MVAESDGSCFLALFPAHAAANLEGDVQEYSCCVLFIYTCPSYSIVPIILVAVIYFLQLLRNGNSFGSYEAISGPIKLVSDSNCSLGFYSFCEISTMSQGQVLQIEMVIC